MDQEIGHLSTGGWNFRPHGLVVNVSDLDFTGLYYNMLGLVGYLVI